MTRKLLFVVSEDWYFVSHRLALATAARDAGFDVSVATQVNVAAAPIEEAGLTLRPIRFARSNVNPLSALAERATLTRLYRKIQPDIVHHVALKPIVVGSAAARKAGVKAVVNAVAGLGYTFASNTPKARLLRMPVRHALRGAFATPNSRVLVQNRDDLEELAATGIADRTTLRLIPGSGVDFARFDLGPPPPGPPLVILPARFLRYKGIAEFVAAAERLKFEGSPARFALVGAPDRSNPASVSSDELSEWRHRGAVELWGWQDDMPSVLRQASIVCLPSYYREGIPKALIEAAAARRPIVTTAVPGCREVVADGRAGWLVAPRDPIALTNALREAILNVRLREQHAAAAHAGAESRYAVAAINAATLAVYDELLATARRD